MNDKETGSVGPAISIIIPVYNNPESLKQCIDSIRRSIFTDYELIIVDDSSTDSTPVVIKESKPDIALHTEKNQGPYLCRNMGAEKSKGKILFFTDSDVCIFPDTLQKIHKHILIDGKDCVIGLYTQYTPSANICSVYKNSWIRYSYMTKKNPVQWFFTAVGAVKREVWDRNRQFEICRRHITGTGDIEFGRSLYDNGIKIFLDKQLEVEHRRHFSLRSLLKNDFCRSMGYTRAGFERDQNIARLSTKGYANVSGAFIYSTLLVALILLSISASLINLDLLYLAGILFLIYLFVNIGFLKYLIKNVSYGFLFKAIAVMLLDHFTCGLGIVAGVFLEVKSTRFFNSLFII